MSRMPKHLRGLLMLGSLWFGVAAEAATPGPVCRTECAPRIERDCAGLAGRRLRRCRRPLIRACKETSPAEACRLSEGGTPPPSGPGTPGSSGGAGGLVGRLEAALADRVFRFGSSEFFSGGSITTESELLLCGSRQFATRVTRITTAPGVGDLSSEESSVGTWRIEATDGRGRLSLDPGAGAAPEQVGVSVDGAGRVRFGGVVATAVDGRARCGVPAGTDPSPPVDAGALIAQLRAALAGQVLVTTETNLGFGRRTTVILLCDSDRYRRQVEVSAAPGRVVTEPGSWRVAATLDSFALELAADAGLTPTRLTLAEDAQGQLVLGGLTVELGDPSLLASVCPQL